MLGRGIPSRLLGLVRNGAANRRILTIVRKWLNTEIVENGRWKRTQIGTPNYVAASPSVVNVSLCYVPTITRGPSTIITPLASKLGSRLAIRRRFASALIWNLLASIASRSTILLAAIGCARFLGKSGFGQFGIVQTTATMVSAVATLGLGITATRYIAVLRERDPERAGRIIGLTWTITAVSGLVAAVVSIITARSIAVNVFHAPELTNSVRIASAIVFLNAMLAYQNGALFGLEVFRGLARINLISGVLSLPIVLVGVWRWGLNGAVTGTAISLAISWWLNESLLHGECRKAGIPIRIRQSLQETTVFWTFSLPALVGSLATASVLWFCSVLIVRSPHGFAQMALYSGADRWRSVILFIPSALIRSALPLLANLHKQNEDGYFRVAKASLQINMGLVLLSVFAVAALSSYIMGSYGPGFRSGWPVLVVFCICTIPEALNTILGYPLIVSGRMWIRCGFDLALSASMLLFGMWLIPLHGALGFASAYLVSYSIISSGLYVVTRERSSNSCVNNMITT